MASHLPIYRNYAHQWRVFKDILNCVQYRASDRQHIDDIGSDVHERYHQPVTRTSQITVIQGWNHGERWKNTSRRKKKTVHMGIFASISKVEGVT